MSISSYWDIAQILYKKASKVNMFKLFFISLKFQYNLIRRNKLKTIFAFFLFLSISFFVSFMITVPSLFIPLKNAIKNTYGDYNGFIQSSITGSRVNIPDKNRIDDYIPYAPVSAQGGFKIFQDASRNLNFYNFSNDLSATFSTFDYNKVDKSSNVLNCQHFFCLDNTPESTSNCWVSTFYNNYNNEYQSYFYKIFNSNGFKKWVSRDGYSIIDNPIYKACNNNNIVEQLFFNLFSNGLTPLILNGKDLYVISWIDSFSYYYSSIIKKLGYDSKYVSMYKKEWNTSNSFASVLATFLLKSSIRKSKSSVFAFTFEKYIKGSDEYNKYVAENKEDQLCTSYLLSDLLNVLAPHNVSAVFSNSVSWIFDFFNNKINEVKKTIFKKNNKLYPDDSYVIPISSTFRYKYYLKKTTPIYFSFGSIPYDAENGDILASTINGNINHKTSSDIYGFSDNSKFWNRYKKQQNLLFQNNAFNYDYKSRNVKNLPIGTLDDPIPIIANNILKIQKHFKANHIYKYTASYNTQGELSHDFYVKVVGFLSSGLDSEMFTSRKECNFIAFSRKNNYDASTTLLEEYISDTPTQFVGDDTYAIINNPITSPYKDKYIWPSYGDGMGYFNTVFYKSVIPLNGLVVSLGENPSIITLFVSNAFKKVSIKSIFLWQIINLQNLFNRLFIIFFIFMILIFLISISLIQRVLLHSLILSLSMLKVLGYSIRRSLFIVTWVYFFVFLIFSVIAFACIPLINIILFYICNIVLTQNIIFIHYFIYFPYVFLYWVIMFLIFLYILAISIREIKKTNTKKVLDVSK